MAQKSSLAYRAYISGNRFHRSGLRSADKVGSSNRPTEYISGGDVGDAFAGRHERAEPWSAQALCGSALNKVSRREVL